MSKKKSIFDFVIKESVPQSTHNLSYINDTTMASGFLTPICYYETVPGDVFFGGTAAFCRTEPLVSPMFTNLDLEIRYFWVPNRFVWSNWREFLTDQKKGVQYGELRPFDGAHPVLDFRDATGSIIQTWCAPGTLADYLGIPTAFYTKYPDSLPSINAIPFRIYNLIWNEFFRDENLHTPAVVSTADGLEGNEFTNYVLRRVCWRKDRFTSALPWPQKGEDVNIDTLVKLYGGMRDVPTDILAASQPSFGVFQTTQGGDARFIAPTGVSSQGAFTQLYRNNTTHGSDAGNIRYNSIDGDAPLDSHNETYGPNLWYDPNGSLSSNISIRRIRQASALQRILEKKAVAGSRYSEYILAMYGVQIPDAENERPTYLGGGSAPIAVHPVEQTSASVDGVTPQGNLAGKGVGAGAYRLSRPWLFNDFGYLMGMAYIRPKASYYQGLRRSLFKIERDDYYNPDYQLIGEEEISKMEISIGANDETFGYQSRYAWLKSRENEIHGNLKSDMLSWVMPHTVGNNPTLNATFVQCTPSESNNFAVDNRPHYIMNFYNDFRARRPMYFLPVLKNGQL